MSLPSPDGCVGVVAALLCVAMDKIICGRCIRTLSVYVSVAICSRGVAEVVS